MDKVWAAIYLGRRAQGFLSTVGALLEQKEITVVVGAADPDLFHEFRRLRAEQTSAESLTDLINQISARSGHVLSVSAPILAPPEFLPMALQILDADRTVATVSFLSNETGFLTFPKRNGPSATGATLDETRMTQRLRALSPTPTPAPVSVAAGSAVLISAAAFSAVGPLIRPPGGSNGIALEDFCLRASRRAFIHLADMGTFYSRPSEPQIGGSGLSRSQLEKQDQQWLLDRHPFADGMIEREEKSTTSPLALEFNCARAKVEGLRILIDATCLGPHQMGTQLTTLSLISALAQSDEVSEVCVMLAAPEPDYGRAVLHLNKVNTKISPNCDPRIFGGVDIGYHPYQPAERFNIAAWRASATRVLVSLLDLISYRNGSYHESKSQWLAYRECLATNLGLVDGVIAISASARNQLESERLPVDPGRVFVVYPGTDHLNGSETARIPDELRDRGLSAGEFLLTLGTNYSHKNRDIAIQVRRELKKRGFDLPLILAGTPVPFGSSQIEEVAEQKSPDDVLVLPSVSSEERNWLLKHSSCVIYPTSAEGFGYLPYEAAAFGTPTVNVGFGPLSEIGGEGVVMAENWDPRGLAAAVEAILSDPLTARKRVESVLRTKQTLTWASTARQLLAIYRAQLGRPPVVFANLETTTFRSPTIEQTR